MWLVSWVGDLIEDLVRRATRFSRTKSEREQLEEVARWDRLHMGLSRTQRKCLTCGHYVPVEVESYETCPGPPAAQEAKRKLKEKGWG